MSARHKVVPPVTPQIVQLSRRQRIVRLVLLGLAFLLTATLAWQAGRRQAPAQVPAPHVAEALQNRIRTLEQERDALRNEITALERRLKTVQHSPAQKKPVTKPARAQSARKNTKPARQKAAAPKPETVSVAPPKSAPPTRVAAQAEPATVPPPSPKPEPARLQLEDIQLAPGDTPGQYRLSFSVRRDGEGTRRVAGAAWIAVDGRRGREPVHLSFHKLSDDGRKHVKLSLEREQRVEEILQLPPDIEARQLLLEIKPWGSGIEGSSRKLRWDDILLP
ncbi:MAG TPA: hypothetical protein ENJ79_06695 [Gammaproteobacteria bacterium]|nr:hypothetical protein [Gammaproteobacteria bacterium]